MGDLKPRYLEADGEVDEEWPVSPLGRSALLAMALFHYCLETPAAADAKSGQNALSLPAVLHSEWFFRSIQSHLDRLLAR